MNKRTLVGRILAVIGTVLVLFTALSPLLFGLLGWILDGRFRFDYLMPAEFFLVALLGAGLLLLGAILTHRRIKPIGWGIAATMFLLLLSQWIAMATGLASGATEAGGWQMALVLVFLALYELALIFVGAQGILLFGDLRIQKV